MSKRSHTDLRPRKTNCVKYPRRQTFMKPSAVSSVFQHSMYYFTSDAIYFKSPIDKASFDVKMTESVSFFTCFNHLPGLLLYFCCLCACASTKRRLFLFKTASAKELHEYFPLRLADAASLGIVSHVAGLVQGRGEGGM